MLTAPSRTNKYYISTGWKANPGYNRCEVYVNGSCLPNCVGYAWGRFMEMAGIKDCSLSRADAKRWYPYTADGYKRGRLPKVGAVICWETRGQYGHVAIVEEIYKDYSILISESAWLGDDVVYNPNNSNHWKTHIIPYDNGNYGTRYANFQGFIYNPYLTSVDNNSEKFAQAVEASVNQKSSSPTAVVRNASAKIAIPVIVDAESCKAAIVQSIDAGLGTLIEKYTKEDALIGDVLLLNDQLSKTSIVDRLAVVTQVLDTQLKVVSNRLASRSQTYVSTSELISFNDSRIVAVYRPLFGSAFNRLSLRDNAMVREFGTVNSKYEPSINISGNIKLSLINYEAAYNFVQVVSGYEPEEVKKRIIAAMMSLPRIIISYLMYHKITIAGAIAICANMYADSQLDASASHIDTTNNKTYIGVCQWTGQRAAQLQKFKDWEALSPQLDFVLNELYTTPKYSALYKTLLITVDAKASTEQFARIYYDTLPDDIDLRLKVCQLLWDCTEEVIE